MSDSTTQKEPSMEEILASIRRIISEDGEGENRPEDGTGSLSEVSVPDDVLELTDIVDDDPAPAAAFQPEDEPTADIIGELTPESEDFRSDTMPPMPDEDSLVSDDTVTAASAALGRLTERADERETAPRVSPPVGDGTRTLEDLVKEALRPMLREWLEKNLPSLVEEIVEREVQKIGRGARR